MLGRLHTWSFTALGTGWQIDSVGPLEMSVRSAIEERISSFDRCYSRFRSDSLVRQMAEAPHGGRFEFPPDAAALFDLYDRLHEVTEGAVDPLVGRDLELLGYDATYSLRPADEAIRERAATGGRPSWRRDVVRDGRELRTRRAVVVDVGAAGKGYLVDLTCDLLVGSGVDRVVVDASGDMRAVGLDVPGIGLEHPLVAGQVIGTAVLAPGRALCASATTRRAWGPGLHHVLDGRTGRPTDDVVATWVVADRVVVADGLATALFFASPETLSREFEFSCVRMYADGTGEISPGFPGELFV